MIGDTKIEYFWKAFRKISVDPMKAELDIIATLDSIKSKLPIIFGVENDFFNSTFYYYLSNGYHDKEIRLPDFISKFKAFNNLIKKDLFEFTYDFLDANRDGQVTLIDLIYFRYLPVNTQLGQEIDNAIETFVQELIIKPGVSRPKAISMEVFKEFFPHVSSLATEVLGMYWLF